MGFLEFSDSYAQKISGQNSHFFENAAFDFLYKVENFFTKISLDQNLSFGFCLIKIGRMVPLKTFDDLLC